MFDMLAEHIHNPPRLFYCDFEKAQINAILKTWNYVIIAGCFFHFSQNLLKHLGMSHLKNLYLKKDPTIRNLFKSMQALAFVPPDKVIVAFKEIVKKSTNNFKPMLTHFEKYYIGNLQKDSQTIRKVPFY